MSWPRFRGHQVKTHRAVVRTPRAQIAEALMQPLAIIEPFNKRENLSSGLAVSLICLVMNQFILQRTEEALGHGVVAVQRV